MMLIRNYHITFNSKIFTQSYNTQLEMIDVDNQQKQSQSKNLGTQKVEKRLNDFASLHKK